MLRKKTWEPDFANLELVLQKKKPKRPVFFDFIIGEDKEKMLIGDEHKTDSEFDRVVSTIKAFDSAGYDHAPIIIRGLSFTRKSDEKSGQTKSLNSGATITDWDSFYNYQWPDINDCDFSIITKAGKYLSPKVKFVPFSLDGILENTIGIVGYENICMMLYDEPELVKKIFSNVGKRIRDYFAKCLEYPEVGAILCNDDWGFNTQTMLPPDVLRENVFPWYKEISDLVHSKGKYVILHSCGNYNSIIEDIVYDIKVDGRHSYEDNITPVEVAYDELSDKIAVLGGIDVDFLARSTPESIKLRSKKMLEKTRNR
ncbi:MAG: uroporphyrinogen decarboxylase family protein [Candidatus Izemoplasmatales bacterium]|nr:uroporphyrinogen decarboxylase family protein [Candidatus Izemoplasmatales bacterium]